MLKCKLCDRSFKTRQALGGHVSRSHSQASVSAADSPLESTLKEAPAAQPVTTETAVPAPSAAEGDEGNAVAAGANREATEMPASKVEEEEEAQSRQIQRYLKQGYTLRQLTDKFGFKETTVRQEMAKMIAPEGEKIVEEAAANDGIPMTRKAGSGMEVLNPEAVLRRYTDGSIKDEIELRGMMKLRAAMLMVIDLVNMQKTAAEADAKRVEPILRLMQEARIEQDAAAARAKESSKEIAERAAVQGANLLAERVMPEIQAMKSQFGASSAPDPITRMMNMLQAIPRMMQMSKQLMGAMGMPMPGSSPQGTQQLQPQQYQQSQLAAQPPGMSGPAPAQQPAEPGLQPGIASEEDIKEAFGDNE